MDVDLQLAAKVLLKRIIVKKSIDKHNGNEAVHTSTVKLLSNFFIIFFTKFYLSL